ncbi:glycosyltransferase [Streptomyces sp. 3MP-14]|uniref:Glycosyltransferase n=1 Tax=Streptomyces mimosae TaxID=2586635 RepID=A0A5N5ZSX1_9ACTN|nr:MULTISPECIES: glycosyltransferase [Streptomyces]KAB8158826.1 glycosyltransferase [Streptomyces mimosae]KAB8172728.1 glycosyltransferase [Streptomyces sp. 3MP-14]
MRVSVIVPAYNARDDLWLLLATLGQNVLDPGDSFEVVVADDGSGDGTERMVRSLAASVPYPLTCRHLPRTARSSRAAARNAAIEAAGGELVLMVDADQVVGPRFVAEHIAYHRHHPRLVVLGPRPDLGEGEIDRERVAREFSLDAMPAVAWGDPRQWLLKDFFSENLNNLQTCWHLMFTCDVSVRREHLTAVGGFDEAYLDWGLEDTDLGYRLRAHGLRFALNPAAVAYHQRGRRVSAEMYAQWSRNLAYMIRKFDGAPEVAAQAVVGRALNPADRGLRWVDAMERFEYAARALAGRLPGRPAPRPLTFGENDVAAGPEKAVAQIAEAVAEADTVVVDETRAGALAGPVQCLATPHELDYFHRVPAGG